MKVFICCDQYGCKHEEIEGQAYVEMPKMEHENFVVVQCGLILDPEIPFMGATPMKENKL